MEKNYTTATLEDYFNTTNNSNTVIAIPKKALQELKDAKNHSELISKTLKKYLINAQQAKTNAKIVEALLA